jgi:hypothetical protein
MMSQHLTINDEITEFLLYTTPNGKVKVEVLLNNETLWLTQKRIAELFGVGVPAVSKHLKNIFESNELDPEAVISIGYRVNSSQATQFRIWATTLLKEYIVKGFTLDGMGG